MRLLNQDWTCYSLQLTLLFCKKSPVTQILAILLRNLCVCYRTHIQRVHSVTSQQQVRVYKEYVFDFLLRRCVVDVSVKVDSKHDNNDIYFSSYCCIFVV